MKISLFKRILSIVVAIVTVFTMTTVAFAKTDSKSADDEIVATITLFCRPNMIIHGHGWIYVENLSKSTLKVGHYELSPSDGVSIGTFANSREDGWGIYYNIEAYSATTYGLDGCTTLTEELTVSELTTLSNKIYNYTNTWNHFINCMYFAFTMWNSVSDITFIPVIFPIFGQLQMLFYDYKTDEPEMKPVTAEQVYRQKGTGDKAYLVQASEGSLDPL